jgi:radial spoke head protein 9
MELQLERLAGLMRWVDEECGVVPNNALVLTPNDVLVKNTAFTGMCYYPNMLFAV